MSKNIINIFTKSGNKNRYVVSHKDADEIINGFCKLAPSSSGVIEIDCVETGVTAAVPIKNIDLIQRQKVKS